MAADLDLVDWLMEIRDAIYYEQTNIWVGFSFLCRNTKSDSIIYIYACEQLAPYHAKFSTKRQFNRFIDTFKGKTHYDLLQETFISTYDDNPLTNSGYVPAGLVCSYIWINK